MNKRTKIAFAITVPSALRAFMADHIRFLAKEYDVTVYCNFSFDKCDTIFDKSVRLINIPFERKIRLWKDFKCWVMLFQSFRNESFDSIHSILPKSGLLSMTAGWAANIPVRIHMFTGQVWITKKGIFRSILKSIDKIISHCATDIYVDSLSQRDFLIQEQVISNGHVLGDGSVNGVDTDRFKPNLSARCTIRKKLDIPDDAVVFGFLGRINRDKGILDLIQAASTLNIGNEIYFIIAGPDEECIEKIISEQFTKIQKQILFTGVTSEPEKIIAAFDVFCIPSYREGFCSSVIEAAACGVPALASRIYGLIDSVEDNVTGLMHELGNIEEINKGINLYVTDIALRKRLGAAARERVLKKFFRDRLLIEMLAEYKKILP